MKGQVWESQMDAMTPVVVAVTDAGTSGIVPSELSVLIWAPLLLIFSVLAAWLWLLIAFQKMEQRQVKPKTLPSESQLEATKTIQNAPMPHGIA
ncbi:MAG TPA: hypothetical protein VFB36_17030 [Nevskiaceae bacterium]|nr:hypothetical protein [Nevskiaceae bacterium]